MEEKEVVVEAFTELAPRYESVVNNELHKFWGWSYEGFIQYLIKNTLINPGDLLLDIATGTCVIPRAIMHTNPNCKVVGVDITQAMLIHGKQKMGSELFGEKVFLTTGDAMQMPFESSSFDLVVCGLATHHMQVSEIRGEIYRILKENGRFSLSDVGGSKLWRSPLINFYKNSGVYLFSRNGE